MRIKIYPPLAIQELGNRDNQEDYIYPAHGKATASDCLFIVCDGMGGHENGEVASQTFAEALADYFRAHATCDTVWMPPTTGATRRWAPRSRSCISIVVA